MKRIRKKANSRRFASIAFFLLIALAVGISAPAWLSWVRALPETAKAIPPVSLWSDAPTARPTQTPGPRIALADGYDTRELWLVNAEHLLTEAVRGDLVPIKGLPLAYMGMELEEDALAQALAMFEDAQASGMTGYVITSAYRDAKKQQELYDTMDRTYVAAPGASEHQTGLAMDVQLLEGDDMAKAEQGKWLADNAHRFGFIQRYPSDKTDITGIVFEPWHFRYVGPVHATYMAQNGLCLEEYIEWLALHPQGYTLTIEGMKYRVYRAESAEEPTALPADGAVYELSGDNAGGLIITVEG